MSLVDFARDELQAIGAPDNGWDAGVQDAVMELVRTFAAQSHSGASAAATLSMFSHLAAWKPLAPLSGAPDEWVEVSDGLFQNRRCSRVFKTASGEVYDINGRVFREPNGVTYTSIESRTPVSFPYWPTIEIVDVEDTP